MTTHEAAEVPESEVPESDDTPILGMWVFLATEVMLFGGLFLAYSVYRLSYPTVFAAASQHLNGGLAAINTAVLLTSSLMMALAGRSAQLQQRRAVIIFLGLTLILGLAFLGIKALEYYGDYREHLMPLFGLSFAWEGIAPEQARLFFNLYYIITGLHALHLTIGILCVSFAGVATLRRRYVPGTFVELVGLYWHFIDIVWIFVFPLLYLVRG